MIIAYISKDRTECFTELKDEFHEIVNFPDIKEFISFYAAHKSRDLILLYKVSQLDEIEALQQITFSKNIYIIVIGEDDISFSLLAGKMGVDVYVTKQQVEPNAIISHIYDSQQVIKKRKGNSNVSVFTGINGGVGTTTITMNLAKTIADEYPQKNVLFLDFSDTKAVSNLFFDIIQPNKTIIDIPSAKNMESDELFTNGLHKITNNFFMIPGIQKHTDKEEFLRTENIQAFLHFITTIKERFDFILIDIGVFKDENLEVDIQELADDIYVITEFNIPSMSVLKTYIDIIDKSGWYNKTHIIANRSDAFGSVTHEEAKKILTKGLKHKFTIDHALPNDAVHLRECWNEAKLVCDTYPDAPFMDDLRYMIRKLFIDSETIINDSALKQNSLLQRMKSWL